MSASYLLCPGLVTSRSDGGRHHVGASQMAMLYGVRMADCLVMSPQTPMNHGSRMTLLDRVRAGDLVALVPRTDGDYRMPEALQ